MATAGSNRRIIRMRVDDPTIYRITVDNENVKVMEGFILCKEYADSQASEIDNQKLPSNNSGFTWRVLIPNYLADATKTPSPDYTTGDLIYAARLDNPVVIASVGSSLNDTSNTHPSTDKTGGWVQMIPSLKSFGEHYSKASMGTNTDSAATDVVFWIDLNVDGRTTGAGSGGGGTTSVVWL